MLQAAIPKDIHVSRLSSARFIDRQPEESGVQDAGRYTLQKHKRHFLSS
jgi:hypothetical protein